MFNKISYALTLVLLLSISTSFAQAVTPERIDSIVSASMSTMPHAAVAVAVVKDGKVIHAKGYGVTSVDTQEKANADTRFAIASNSKSFTGLALAILVDEGKIQWTDKVVDYIPEFKMYDPYVTQDFMIVDLLTHRSGLGLGAGDLMFFPDGSDFTIDDVLKSFQYQKQVSPFRTKYDYDNLLYGVAGELTSRISGMSWPEFIDKKILTPLAMDNTAGLYELLDDKNNVAVPHSALDGKLTAMSTFLKIDQSMAAAGGIYSSVNDMSKWLMTQLAEGKYGEDLSKELLSKEAHNFTWKPQTFVNFSAKPTDSYNQHFTAYALGWFVSDKNGYVALEHTGGLPGMLSSTLLIPELNAGVVVLTNTDPGAYSFWSIRAEIRDLLLGAERTDWITSMVKRIESRSSQGDSVVAAVWNTVKKAKTKNLQKENFTGTYRDNWFGDITIDIKDGKLWFTSKRSPKLNGEMFFYQANTFAVKWEFQDMPCDAFAMFNLDENGKATSIKMKGISPNIDFSFDFHDLDLKRVNQE